MISTLPLQPPKKPLIAILGATGTGKSQLAVELAKKHNGEVINGDAMQLYAGLPVITNKITQAEQQGIPHHLLGCISLEEPTWVVSTFVKRALATIEEIRARGKLPILVGGTHYYTQSLLFHEALADEDGMLGKTSSAAPEEQWPILAESTATLLAQLQKVDPVMAGRWHPNDRRKIQRSLMIYLQTGKRASDVYTAQRQSRLDHTHEDNEHPRLRFPCLLFWVHTETETLRKRLDTRVEVMIDNGLMQEVQQLEEHAAAKLAHGETVDESRGIWVSIGFKEFKPYHTALRAGASPEMLAKLKSEAIEKTKIANRQYAKRQVRWIRIKLVNALTRADASNELYLLDSSSVDRFEEDVIQPAAKLASQFLNGTARPAPVDVCVAAAEQLSSLNADGRKATDKKVVQHCQLCGVTCATDLQWEAHIKSKAHKKLSSRQRDEVFGSE